MKAEWLLLAAAVAVMALAAAFLPGLSAAEDPDDDPEADVTVKTLRVEFTDTSSNALYVIWDFGDGTVLDGRWEHYRGATLTDPDMINGWSAYVDLLSRLGGNIHNPMHAYAENGVYDMTITAVNPIGWENGGERYTSDHPINYSAFDGGLFSDSTHDKDRGSHDTKHYIIKVDASERDGFNWLPIIVIIIGAVVALVGSRFHPAFIIVGAAIAAFGAVWALGWIDPGVRL